MSSEVIKKIKLASVVISIAFVVALAACAPQQRDDSESSTVDDNTALDSQVIAVHWTPDSDCLACHAGYNSSTTMSAHETQGLDCFTCHDVDELQSVHDEHGDSGKTPNRLKYSEIDFAKTCLASECHTSMEALAAETSEVVLTDSNGFTINPHAAPSGVEEHDSITCGNCHTVHADEDVLANADKKCFGCHHQQVFECGTCHSV